MSKDKKILEFLLCLFLGELGVHKFYSGKIGMGILYLLTCGLFGIGWFIDTIKLLVELLKKEPEPKSAPIVSAPKATPITQPKANVAESGVKPSAPVDGTKNYNLFNDIVDKYALRYKYEKEICILEDDTFSLVKGQGGKQIEFRLEPNNTSDPEAVAIYLNDNKLGYVYKGQTQEMIHSWIERKLPFVGHINKFSESEKKITYKIGFYYPLAKFESMQVKLVATTKKIDEFESRADNVLSSSVGDYVTVEQDFDSDKYVVFNESYSEIGELPKSAVSFIEGSEHKKVVGLIDEITDDEKPVVLVTIYLIK